MPPIVFFNLWRRRVSFLRLGGFYHEVIAVFPAGFVCERPPVAHVAVILVFLEIKIDGREKPGAAVMAAGVHFAVAPDKALRADIFM